MLSPYSASQSRKNHPVFSSSRSPSTSALIKIILLHQLSTTLTPSLLPRYPFQSFLCPNQIWPASFPICQPHAFLKLRYSNPPTMLLHQSPVPTPRPLGSILPIRVRMWLCITSSQISCHPKCETPDRQCGWSKESDAGILLRIGYCDTVERRGAVVEGIDVGRTVQDCSIILSNLSGKGS